LNSKRLCNGQYPLRRRQQIQEKYCTRLSGEKTGKKQEPKQLQEEYVFSAAF
jgi:hypothetical protein